MQIRQILIKEITFKSSPLKPVNQIKPNEAGVVPGWVPFNFIHRNDKKYVKCPGLKWLFLGF